MAHVSISEAARLAKVSRSTLNRHLKDGTISKHKDNAGRPYVDTSELLRVYGELSQQDRTGQDSLTQHGTPNEQQAVLELQRKLEAAETALEVEKALRQKVEESEAKWHAQAERLTTLLVDQREQEPSPSPSRGLSLFGFQITKRSTRS